MLAARPTAAAGGTAAATAQTAAHAHHGIAVGHTVNVTDSTAAAAAAAKTHMRSTDDTAGCTAAATANCSSATGASSPSAPDGQAASKATANGTETIAAYNADIGAAATDARRSADHNRIHPLFRAIQVILCGGTDRAASSAAATAPHRVRCAVRVLGTR